MQDAACLPDLPPGWQPPTLQEADPDFIPQPPQLPDGSQPSCPLPGLGFTLNPKTPSAALPPRSARGSVARHSVPAAAPPVAALERGQRSASAPQLPRQQRDDGAAAAASRAGSSAGVAETLLHITHDW